jgi:hypothetical protein
VNFSLGRESLGLLVGLVKILEGIVDTIDTKRLDRRVLKAGYL